MNPRNLSAKEIASQIKSSEALDMIWQSEIPKDDKKRSIIFIAVLGAKEWTELTAAKERREMQAFMDRLHQKKRQTFTDGVEDVTTSVRGSTTTITKAQQRANATSSIDELTALLSTPKTQPTVVTIHHSEFRSFK